MCLNSVFFFKSEYFKYCTSNDRKHYFPERYAIYTDYACLLRTFLKVFNGDKLTAFNSSKKFRLLNLKFPDADKRPKEYNCT